MLYLSAAFDTLDHSGVIGLLDDWYGISGNALQWFASELTDRQQMIGINIFTRISKQHMLVSHPKQSMEFPKALSLGRTFSHSSH